MQSKGGTCEGDSLPSFPPARCALHALHTLEVTNPVTDPHGYLCVTVRESNPQPFSWENEALSITQCAGAIILTRVASTQKLKVLYYINSYMVSPLHCKRKSCTWLNTT